MSFVTHIVVCLAILNVVLSQSENYTLFISTVCDEPNEDYYSLCSCNLATWATGITNKIAPECWNAFNCYYDFKFNQFCSGNGVCNFNETTCECNEGWGSRDCSQTYITYHVKSYISTGMLIFSGILLLFSLGLMVWVHLYRDVGDVKAMSVVFTHLTLVGCASVCAGATVLGLGYTNATCMILEWFQFLGICSIISCALLKAYRIASIFSSTNFSPSDLTDTVLLKYFLLFMIVDVVLLVIYTIFNFVDGGAYDRPVQDRDGLYNEVRCSSQPLTMLSYSLLVAWQLVLLLFVLKYGNATRSAAKIFKETKCIYVGSNIGSIMFIAFGIFVLFTTNYTLQIVIRGYGSLTVVLMVQYLLFSPKFKAVYDLRVKKKGKQTIGSKEDEEERKLKNQYEANLKDPNGKELLLLLDALVRELAYRADMKMIQIELKDVDLMKCLKLLDTVKCLVPQPVDKQYNQEHSTAFNTHQNDTNNTKEPNYKKVESIQSNTLNVCDLQQIHSDIRNNENNKMEELEVVNDYINPDQQEQSEATP